jgi:alkylation response protein AidB-like acyl-CoA dehydrogenase
MDLTFSAEERAFEQEVRDFIAQNLTPEMRRATALTPSVFSDPEIGMAWQRALHKKGWAAPGWPVPAIPEAMLPIVPEYLNGRAYTIFGGSSEIQRDIVAKMVLGL